MLPVGGCRETNFALSKFHYGFLNRLNTNSKKVNTMDDEKMFCFQCQETARGTGCTVRGVCGKLPQTSMYMDTLLAVTRGVGAAANALREGSATCADGACQLRPFIEGVGAYITRALFATITNANFDDSRLGQLIADGLTLCDRLKTQAREAGIALPQIDELVLPIDSVEQIVATTGRRWRVSRHAHTEDGALREFVLYGLKGMAAYYEHAARLGHTDPRIVAFMCYALATISRHDVDVDALTALLMDTGKYGVDTMALLDRAHTAAFGQPSVTQVSLGTGKRPGILISGHDLHDLADLLQQTEGTGIDIYTHGEMLPGHYYPQLRRHRHLVGHYGNAWWQQRQELEHFHGPIVFTTNCLVPPQPGAGYADKVFTLHATGYPGWRHLSADAKGHVDFSEVIELARHCPPPEPLEQGTLTGGFAHGQVLAMADRIVAAIRQGTIRRMVVMSGCDGRMASRQYYTDFARALPADTLILTSGCAKYRYIKLPLGTVAGLPRVLDAGQCNDSYSWALVAIRLSEALGVEQLEQLPITFNIAWYEQKAVIVLLALLSLGFKNIHIGPTLPAFVTPAMLGVLVSRFGVSGIGSVDHDITLIG